MTLQNPIEVFESKIRLFNNYLGDHYDKFSDLMMFYHDEDYNRSSNFSLGCIPDNLIDRGMIIFIDKFLNKKPYENLNEEEYKEVFNILDRMLDLYLHIEKNSK
ncbi:MAG TPA: hypothetical protein VJ881_04530 [Halanaerobiales bacterium]|nr:hypothetical protein [Halanaerobiales bacterium]